MTNTTTTKKSLINLLNFKHRQLRLAHLNNPKWFLAKDVCKTLGIDNATQAVHDACLQPDELSMLPIEKGGWAMALSISGVNKLILYSRKPKVRTRKLSKDEAIQIGINILQRTIGLA